MIATVPDAITDLAATASGPTQIDLAWSAPDDNGAAVSGYKIEASPDGSSDWTELVANTGTTAISYSHTGLLPGTTRHYRVSAINSAGTGPASNIDDATTPFPMLGVSFGAATYTATEGGTAASVTVSLSGMPLREVEIEVTATNQGTTTGGDYSGVPVTLTFGASETSKTFSVTATDDSDDDDGESVQLGIGTPLPSGLSLGSQTTATVNLTDNDLGVPALRPTWPPAPTGRRGSTWPGPPRVRRRRRHQRLPHRGLHRCKGHLDRARGRHLQHRHLLHAHRPHRRRLPPLPGLRHQLRGHQPGLRPGRGHHAGRLRRQLGPSALRTRRRPILPPAVHLLHEAQRRTH